MIIKEHNKNVLKLRNFNDKIKSSSFVRLFFAISCNAVGRREVDSLNGGAGNQVKLQLKFKGALKQPLDYC